MYFDLVSTWLLWEIFLMMTTFSTSKDNMKGNKKDPIKAG
jgi:hypothetical protein